MYDDFWAGYNSGNGLSVNKPYSSEEVKQVKQNMAQNAGRPITGIGTLGTYDKTKIIKMKGPNGEIGELYANGAMYILLPNGKSHPRKFPSRPWGIRYMQKRGWVLI